MDKKTRQLANAMGHQLGQQPPKLKGVSKKLSTFRGKQNGPVDSVPIGTGSLVQALHQKLSG